MAVNWTNVTSWSDVLATPNTNSGGWFWMLILYGTFIVSTLLLSWSGFEASLLVSSFIGLIFGLMLVYGDVVAWQWLLPFVGIIIFLMLYISWNRRN